MHAADELEECSPLGLPHPASFNPTLMIYMELLEFMR
jgi:hypothetical protein